VFAAALDVIDADGLDALTMRRLGRELGVEAMSLYHHVTAKDDVLNGIVDLLLGRVELPGPDGEWQVWARRFASAYREVAREHPHAFPLVALRALRTAEAFRPVEMGLEVLHRAGFDDRLALAAFQTLANFTSGFALEEIAFSGGQGSPAMATLDADEFPHLHALVRRPMKRDVAFDRGLDIILAGLEAQLEA
jgi:AcrR family transcriptional regulator